MTEVLVRIKKTGRFLRHLLRPLRLQLFSQLSNFRDGTEVKQTAIHSSRSIAAFYALSHLFPIAGCTVLVILNLKVLPLQRISPSDVPAFQFAAKLLEILIQASITSMVLMIIRCQALGKDSLPFGMLLAPYRITDVSFLWSMEFWGIFTSLHNRHWTQIVQYAVTPIAVILAALVGPACAILMVPQYIPYRGISDIWLLPPINELYPTQIVLNNGSLDFESEYEVAINLSWRSWNTDTAIVTSDGFDLRSIWVSNSSMESTSSFITSVPTAMSSTILTTYQSVSNSTSVTTLQPYVHTDCFTTTMAINATSTDLEGQYISFGPQKRYLDNFMPAAWFTSNFTSTSNDDSFVILPITGNGWNTSIALSRSPPAATNTSLLLASVDLTGTNYDSDVARYRDVVACTVHATWASTFTERQYESPTRELLRKNTSVDPASLYSSLEGKRQILLSPTWSGRVLEVAIGSAGTMWDDQRMFTSIVMALALSYTPPLLEGVGISYGICDQGRIGMDVGLSTEQNQTLFKFVNETRFCREHTDLFLTFSDLSNWTDPAGLSQIEVTAPKNGYGYSANSVPVRLSLAVVLFYILTGLVYLIYTIAIGHAASSWDSVSELVTLALNSQPPQALHNTSVGINTLETFQQPVNVRVNTDKSLEIVFVADSDALEHYGIVVPNHEY